MPKKLVAVTEIRHDDLIIPAGETLDASVFEKAQLEQLYDAGAVRVEETQDEPQQPAKTIEKPTTAEASSPAKASPAKSTAPAVKETTNAKGVIK